MAQPSRPGNPRFRWEDIYNYSDASPGGIGTTGAVSSSVVIPKGTLLFSYDNIFNREPEGDFRNRTPLNKTAILLQQMTRICMAQTHFQWNLEHYGGDGGYFSTSIGRSESKYKYFYPTPFAGLGVGGFGHNYNCCWVCITTCDITLSEPMSTVSNDLSQFTNANRLTLQGHFRTYFRNGRLPPDFQGNPQRFKDYNIQHRRQTPENPLYVDRKFLQCDQMPAGFVSHRGNDYDACNDYRYADKLGISGVKSIAQLDTIFQIHNQVKPIGWRDDNNNEITDTMPNLPITDALRVMGEAKIALQNTPLLNQNQANPQQTVNLQDFSLVNVLFCESDRRLDNRNTVAPHRNECRINFTVPEITMGVFGDSSKEARGRFPGANRNGVSRVITFPYNNWINYLTGGDNFCSRFDSPGYGALSIHGPPGAVIQIPSDTRPPLPVYPYAAPLPACPAADVIANYRGIERHLKVMPIGLIMCTTGNYGFVNLYPNVGNFIPGVNGVQAALTPGAAILHPLGAGLGLQQHQDARYRSIYFSSILYLGSFPSGTISYNTIKKMLHLNFGENIGYQKTSQLFIYNTATNQLAQQQNYALLRAFDYTYRAPAQLNAINLAGSLNRMFKIGFIADLFQSYLTVKYRHLKYNKGVYCLNNRIRNFFNVTRLRDRYYAQGQWFVGTVFRQINPRNVYEALGQINNAYDIFQDVRNEFFNEAENNYLKRFFTPNPKFSPIFCMPVDYNQFPIYEDFDTDAKGPNAHSTPLYYFYRKLLLMCQGNLDTRNIVNWTVYTRILYVFVAFILTFEARDPAQNQGNPNDTNFLDFQDIIYVPAGFNYESNEINNAANGPVKQAVYAAAQNGDGVIFERNTYRPTLDAAYDDASQKLFRNNCRDSYQYEGYGGKRNSKRNNKIKKINKSRKNKKRLTKLINNKTKFKTRKLRIQTK